MATKLNPYINFKNTTREAMEFYKTVFGGKLTINTFAEFHAEVGPQEANNVMHSALEVDNGIMFMASDTPAHMGEVKEGSHISMSLSGDDEAELKGYWEKLSVGGNVIVPMEKAPWGDTFGMLTDKFGIKWMINVLAKKA